MDTASYLVYIRNMHIAQPNYSECVKIKYIYRPTLMAHITAHLSFDVCAVSTLYNFKA